MQTSTAHDVGVFGNGAYPYSPKTIKLPFRKNDEAWVFVYHLYPRFRQTYVFAQLWRAVGGSSRRLPQVLALEVSDHRDETPSAAVDFDAQLREDSCHGCMVCQIFPLSMTMHDPHAATKNL